MITLKDKKTGLFLANIHCDMGDIEITIDDERVIMEEG